MTGSAALALGADQMARTARAEEAEQRSLAAVLRWRARWLLKRLGPELAAAARLVPMLLQASLPHPLLRAEAPGVVGQQRFRRSWSGWARLASASCAVQRAGSFSRERLTSDTRIGTNPHRNIARQPKCAPTV